MKIQKRMLLSNAWILTLALLVLLGISSILFNILRTEGDVEGRIYGDQEIFEAAQQLVGFNGNDLAELDRILKEENYQFLIYQNGEAVAINIDSDNSLKKQITKMNLSTQPGLWYLEPNIVVGAKISIAGKGYDAYIVLPIDEEETIVEGHRIKLSLFLVVGLLAVVLILIFSLLFTKRMTKRIITPVNKLLNSANRIEQGDLSTPIEYRGEEEFETLCDAFNHMQEHLKREQEKNAAFECARTDMVAGISHDLRTPLTSIKGYVKGILDGVAATPEKQQAYLKIVYEKAISMEKLLQKLFLYSKLETGNLPFNFIETDMNEFLGKYIQQEIPELEHRGVILNYTVASDNEYPVTIDTEQLTRVMGNLLENAVKYSQSPALEIAIGLKRNDDFATITIKDNGVGVSKDKIGHIFEQFYCADEARGTSGKEGNGLGLYIVKHIVTVHQGTITAENDKGLKITIRIPLTSQKKWQSGI
ncbi:HAMP domain-containing sensor histidine kinase [Acetobacterium wieringae]|uniref:sensor histidine kinase n=1 Tax=Acetobacterium wieringae TaxID=52694 RepID=UPI0026F2AA5A|nr:HAMP domain-containing sensor histidine kinase [Acetobacterium wieringae]